MNHLLIWIRCYDLLVSIPWMHRFINFDTSNWNWIDWNVFHQVYFYIFQFNFSSINRSNFESIITRFTDSISVWYIDSIDIIILIHWALRSRKNLWLEALRANLLIEIYRYCCTIISETTIEINISFIIERKFILITFQLNSKVYRLLEIFLLYVIN